MPIPPTHPEPDYTALKADIVRWGQELGFQQVGVADTNLGQAEARLGDWLRKNYHGEMDYMQRHGTRRFGSGDRGRSHRLRGRRNRRHRRFGCGDGDAGGRLPGVAGEHLDAQPPFCKRHQQQETVVLLRLP